MRGEHSARTRYNYQQIGSSPHARGTRRSRSLLPVTDRIIPACAGNTLRVWNKRGGRTDHPRMRGEHTVRRSSLSSPNGSSPHARGTPMKIRRDEGHVRIIPACAGNTFPPTHSDEPRTDHPRMRGEHLSKDRSRAVRNGSSPHARGTPLEERPACPPLRIIPACAGNTMPIRPRRRSETDHPRMRGEHWSSIMSPTNRSGSSPHARGTLLRELVEIRASRIIPACAGNTHYLEGERSRSTDHPRMRGEHQRYPEIVDDQCRIIPACAGNTPTAARACLSAADHPRMRGEHKWAGWQGKRGIGSSPHARGTQR